MRSLTDARLLRAWQPVPDQMQTGVEFSLMVDFYICLIARSTITKQMIGVEASMLIPALISFPQQQHDFKQWYGLGWGRCLYVNSGSYLGCSGYPFLL